MKKRLFTLVLTLCMLMSLLSTGAFATDIVKSGSCGKSVSYTLDSDGLLTISGTGKMGNYAYREDAPWYQSRHSIKAVIIENGVTTIGRNAFGECENLSSISIPDSVTIIEGSAISSCHSLSSITIPDSITSIGDSAFSYCNSLKNIIIPNNVTSIGSYAFSYCDSLLSVSIGRSVTEIDTYAFTSCSLLESIKVVEENDKYSSLDGVLFNKDKTSIIRFPGGRAGDYVIPNGVTTIGRDAFLYCNNLSGITIPNSVTRIGFWAFGHCTSLTSVTIPSSVKNIDSFAFSNCESLTSIQVAENNTVYISANGGVIDKTKASLILCPAGKSGDFVIPESVKSIGDYAFSYCDKLMSVTIPDSVSRIRDHAFYGCIALTDVYYSGTEKQWNNIEINNWNAPLYSANRHYCFRGSSQQLRVNSISPNFTTVSIDTRFTIVFNEDIEFGNGYLTLRSMAEGGKSSRFDLNNRNGIATISGNTVTINLGEIILPDGWYDAEISPKAFKSKDGNYFLGMPGKGLWQFEVCSGLAQESVMQYAQKGHYFWKSDDTTKPAIPNGSDSEYASILMNWFNQFGLQSISKQELLSELSEPMYLPVSDVNGSTVLLNDKSTTVKQTLEDILFLESLKPFAVSIDSKLSTIEKWDQDGVLGYFSPLHQERKVYKEILGWYPQVDEYLSKRNGNSNLFYSSDAPLAYLFILTGAEDAGGMFFQYSKPFLKAQLDSSILQSSLNGLSQYKNYGDFKTAVTDGKASIKGLKAIYTAYSEGAPAGAKSIIKFGSDLLQTYFKDSNNSTLKDIGEAWSDYDTAMGAGELCAFLGGSIGAFPMVIELYDDLFTKVKDSVAAGYFIGDYYVAEKYPGLYDAIYDDETTFPEYSVYKMTESDYISTIDGDPILHNWCEYLSRITEGAMRDDCRQLRFDLVNYIMLLKYAQEFDVDAAKEALVKYISAECNQQKTTELYASCPVTVEVYSKENDQLVATLSSEDEDIFSCEYGSLYLMGEDNETKCFVLNSSDYYASILPYADGTMDVAVVSTDENGLPVGKTFSDVALKAGSTLKLDLDDMDSGLQTQNGDIIEKESTVPVQRINISGKSEVAVGAKSTLSAEVLPEIASEKRLTWTSADTSIATVDNNGTITGVAFGETVITATSADGVTEDFAISVFVPSTELHVDKTQLRMVKGESFTLHASTTEGATHSVRWKSTNLNSVVVSADGVLTAKEAGDAIVTASIDGKEAEVLVVVSDESLDVMMYQTDLGGNALHLAMANPSCEKSLSGSAYVAVYESGRMIDLKEISIDLESNQEKTEMIALPDFSAEKTYSAVFYPLGDIAQDMQPEEIVFVNESYELKDSTEAASSELTECQKVTVTYDNAQPGVGYTLYVLSDDSGVPTNENIVFMGHKIAENNNLTFTVCPSEEYQDKECYVYVSDAESELHYLSSISGLGHKTELSGVKEATCTTDGYSGDEVCTICGEPVKQGFVIKATGHKWDNGNVTKQPTETAEGVKTYTCVVCGETKTEAIPVLEPVVNPFTDVAEGKYYYDAVLWAVNQDPQVTSGYADGTFRPDQTCTRAQVVTFLWRAKGCPEPTTTVHPFKDVNASAYYYKAVLWAVEQGITTGYADGTFRPDDECSRGQVVTFLWRAKGQPKPTSTANPFSDVPAGKYFTTAVLWALENNITTGRTTTTFGPDDACTRGHVVTFLYRAYN